MAADQVLRIALAPLLLSQGLWVSWSSLKLPEPPGERSGGTGGERLLILGDSSAAGVGANHQTDALSGQLAKALSERGLQAQWLLEAETGATTKTSLAKLDTLAESRFDIAVLVHGVNDTTRFTSSKTFRQRHERLIDRLSKECGVQHFVLSGLPPMHHFPLLPQPLRWVMGAHAHRLDRVLAKIAQDRSDYQHLPLDLPFEPRYVAPDGFHPSKAAYAVWAEILAKAIRAQLDEADRI